MGDFASGSQNHHQGMRRRLLSARNRALLEKALDLRNKLRSTSDCIAKVPHMSGVSKPRAMYAVQGFYWVDSFESFLFRTVSSKVGPCIGSRSVFPSHEAIAHDIQRLKYAWRRCCIAHSARRTTPPEHCYRACRRYCCIARRRPDTRQTIAQAK